MTLEQFIEWIQKTAHEKGIDPATAQIRYIDFPSDGPQDMKIDEHGRVSIY